MNGEWGLTGSWDAMMEHLRVWPQCYQPGPSVSGATWEPGMASQLSLQFTIAPLPAGLQWQHHHKSTETSHSLHQIDPSSLHWALADPVSSIGCTASAPTKPVNSLASYAFILYGLYVWTTTHPKLCPFLMGAT